MLQKLLELVALYDDYMIELTANAGYYAIIIRDKSKGGKTINDTTCFETLEYCVACAYKSFIDYAMEEKGYGVFK